MARCDLCGGECAAHAMTQLLSSYRIAGVVDVCPSCARWLNKRKSELLDKVAPAMRAVITERKASFAAASGARRLWWHFIHGLLWRGWN